MLSPPAHRACHKQSRRRQAKKTAKTRENDETEVTEIDTTDTSGVTEESGVNAVIGTNGETTTDKTDTTDMSTIVVPDGEAGHVIATAETTKIQKTMDRDVTTEDTIGAAVRETETVRDIAATMNGNEMIGVKKKEGTAEKKEKKETGSLVTTKSHNKRSHIAG